MLDLIVVAEVIWEMSERQVKGFYISLIILSRFVILLFDYLTVFSSVFRFLKLFNPPELLFYTYKDFCSCELLLIRSNIALIIAYRYLFSLSRIAWIIWTCLAGKRLLNCSLIAQVCSRDLTISAIDVKICSRKYVDCSDSKLSIRFTAWRHRYLFSMSIVFTTNVGITVAMVSLVATVFGGV